MQSSDEKLDETMANKTDVKVPAVNDDTLTQGKRRKSAPVKTGMLAFQSEFSVIGIKH